MPPRQETCCRKKVLVDEAALESGTVPHFYEYLESKGKADYFICIPSFNRPEKLCRTTMRLLKRHGIDLNRVHIFVAPSLAPKETRPEWSRYVRELREHNFGAVHVEPGGDNLREQMQAIFNWATEGSHVVCLSDDVDDIQEMKMRKDGSIHKKTLASGSLDALFQHAWDLMRAGNFSAWGLNASKNPLCMDTNVISRKLGLIEGNCWGIVAKPYLTRLVTDDEMSVIYDVAFTTELWATERRFFRYRGLAAATTYKTPGGTSTYMSPMQRRSAEDAKIQQLSSKHAAILQFKAKERASLSTQQFWFSQVGPSPLQMSEPSPVTAGRRYEVLATRSMTATERKRKQRGGHGAVVAGGKRSPQAVSKR